MWSSLTGAWQSHTHEIQSRITGCHRRTRCTEQRHFLADFGFKGWTAGGQAHCPVGLVIIGGVEKKFAPTATKKERGEEAPMHCARSTSDRAPFLQMLRMRLELLIGASWWSTPVRAICGGSCCFGARLTKHSQTPASLFLAWRFDLYPKVFLKGYERRSDVVLVVHNCRTLDSLSYPLRKTLG